MSVTVGRTIRVAEMKGLDLSESMRLAEYELDQLIAVLRRLDTNDWDKPTDCDRWTVRDITAHVLGWAEALTSPAEMVRQSNATRRIRKEIAVKLDAQNEAQVRARRDLSPADLLARLESAGQRFLRLRRRVGVVGRPIPVMVPPVGLTNVRFLMVQIFTRDHFMHRIDITRATGEELILGSEDAWLVADVVRHWVRAAKPDARLELTGPAGGTFVCGTGGRSIIRGDAIEFCRLMAGRADVSVMEVERDEAAARRWLTVPVPF